MLKSSNDTSTEKLLIRLLFKRAARKMLVNLTKGRHFGCILLWIHCDTDSRYFVKLAFILKRISRIPRGNTARVFCSGAGNYFCPRATLRLFRCLAGQTPVQTASIKLKNWSLRA